MEQLIKITSTDLKLIFRDPPLRVFLFMPILIILIPTIVLPEIVENYPLWKKFVPVILIGATLQASTMFGFIYCTVLIDEKDTQVVKMYGILPVSKVLFIVLRLLMPSIYSIIVCCIILIAQPFYNFSFGSILIYAILIGLFTPILALGVAVLSDNKMEGMTWYKILNLIITIPLIAFFIPKGQIFFGVIPTHWIYQSLSQMILGQDITLFFGIGYLYTIVLLIFLIRRFVKVHFE